MSKANILTIFFVSILIFVFITLPIFGEFLKEKRILDDKKDDFLKQEQYFAKLKNVDSSLAARSSELEMIDLAISDDSIVPSLVYYLERSSENNGLFFGNVKSVSKKDSDKFSDLKELELSFFVSGSYPNFKNFIKTLEESIKIIEIRNLSVSLDLKNEEQKESLLYNVTIKTYFY